MTNYDNPDESKKLNQHAIIDREGRLVTQGSFNALMSQLDKNENMHAALKTVGCRLIPRTTQSQRYKCPCVVCAALR